ncbi:hypothetical protein QYE76_017950 [Lolium multiflorum]|uniref:CCHC-type domain-containing protein n=1 Tax=Lolium multiflorum TaxID=4521 RepID=A0AAD8QDW5_LOLMU|nr:hypothetical protein QYE76_017950 [Lolium multiflorum]
MGRGRVIDTVRAIEYGSAAGLQHRTIVYTNNEINLVGFEIFEEHEQRVTELFSMLKSAEVEIQKEHQVLMVNKTTSFKKQGKPNHKGNFKKGGKKAHAPHEKPKADPKPDTVCYYCKEKGHWKRNCPKYLADLKSGHVKERSEGKIFVAKNGSFLEKEFLTKEVTGRKVELDEVDEPSLVDQSSAMPEDVPAQPALIGDEANDDDHETSNEEATEPRRSTRERTTPDWYDPCLNVMIVDNNDEDPATYEEAMVIPDSNKWQEAMKSKMGSMYDNKSGYVFILNGAAVSWMSSKQCTVAKSSTESEYIAASEASSEAVWMKRFIVKLGVVPSALDPLVIYCDNTGAIEPRSHKKLKHIKLRFHSIREYIEDGEVEICKVHTDLNVADPLTKALPRAKHDQHHKAMGVRYLTM